MSHKWSSGVGGLCSRIATWRIGADSAHLRLAFSNPRVSLCTTDAPSVKRIPDDVPNADEIDAPTSAPLVASEPVQSVQPSPFEGPSRPPPLGPLSHSQQPVQRSSLTPSKLESPRPQSDTVEKSGLYAHVASPPNTSARGGEAFLPAVTAASPLPPVSASGSNGANREIQLAVSGDSPQVFSTFVRLEICNSLRLVRICLFYVK